MLKKFLLPQYFLRRLSLHIGMVTICSMGIMLYIISFFINMFGTDPEFNDTFITIHWFIVMTFIIQGSTTYICGMVAAWKESHRLATFTMIGLLVNFIAWIILTGLSFINHVTINRITCIDNRCADRLFIKNGNWRQADEEYCTNPSKLRGILLGDIDLEEAEGRVASGHSTEKEEKSADKKAVFVDYIYDHNLGSDTLTNLEKHDKLHEKDKVKKNDKQSRRHRNKRNASTAFGLPVRDGLRFPIRMRNETSHSNRAKLVFFDEGSGDESSSSGDYEEEKVPRGRQANASDDDSNNLRNTPIGYVGCNAPQHIAFSVICALMVLCLWYVYPLIIIHAYAHKLKSRKIQGASIVAQRGYSP